MSKSDSSATSAGVSKGPRTSRWPRLVAGLSILSFFLVLLGLSWKYFFAEPAGLRVEMYATKGGESFSRLEQMVPRSLQSGWPKEIGEVDLAEFLKTLPDGTTLLIIGAWDVHSRFALKSALEEFASIDRKIRVAIIEADEQSKIPQAHGVFIGYRDILAASLQDGEVVAQRVHYSRIRESLASRWSIAPAK